MTRFPKVPKRLTAVLALALGVSCTNPAWVCGCPPEPPQLVGLYGRVTGPSGAVVQGAVVTVQLDQGSCAEEMNVYGAWSTGADGGYRGAVEKVMLRPEMCVRAFAAPPAQSGLRASDTVSLNAVFGTPAADSARVDLVLRAP